MNTGLIESWSGDPSVMGPLYPFVGSEIVLFVFCFAFWIVYTIWQLWFEARGYAREAEDLRQGQQLQSVISGNRPYRAADPLFEKFAPPGSGRDLAAED